MSDEEDQSNQLANQQAVAKNDGSLLGKRKTQGSENRVKEAQTKRQKADD